MGDALVFVADLSNIENALCVHMIYMREETANM